MSKERVDRLCEAMFDAMIVGSSETEVVDKEFVKDILNSLLLVQAFLITEHVLPPDREICIEQIADGLKKMIGEHE